MKNPPIAAVLVAIVVALAGIATSASAANRDVVIGNFPVYSEWSLIQSAEYGWLHRDNDVVGYHRIPYAAPPVLHKAFHMPVDYDHAPWPVIDALPENHPGDTYQCIQATIEGNPAGTPDCLYLNIFRPNHSYAAWPPAHYTDALPVVIWIHGGSMVAGHGMVQSNMLHGLARRGMVVVSINYRLGITGFATKINRQDQQNGMMDADGLVGTAGNYGLWDQQKAIRWVYDNIHRFGGDKQQISLMGESAGGYSAMAQATTSTNTLPFRSVIQQSADVFSNPLDSTLQDVHAGALEAGTYPDFDEAMPALINPCPATDPNPLLCWRYLSSNESEVFIKWMVRATQAIQAERREGQGTLERRRAVHGAFYGVHHDVDGAFFRKPFWDEFQEGFSLPFLSFVNEHEFGFASLAPLVYWADYWSLHDPAHAYGPEDVGLILSLPKSTFNAHLNTPGGHYAPLLASVSSLEEASDVAARMISDVFLCTSHGLLPSVVEGQGQSLVRRVRLDDVPDLISWLGNALLGLPDLVTVPPLTLQAVTEYANHIYELFFLDQSSWLTAKEKSLGARMLDTWAAFMKDPTVLVNFFYGGYAAVTVFEDPGDIHAPSGSGTVRGEYYFNPTSMYAGCSALTAAGMLNLGEKYLGMTNMSPAELGYD